jgi:diadenosine tetraphosphate (Ap4A) HIT family hydrolase
MKNYIEKYFTYKEKYLELKNIQKGKAKYETRLLKQSQCVMCNSSTFKFKILETDYWKVTLATEQSYLGRFYVILKRHEKSLKNLTIEEVLDWHNIVIIMEKSLQHAFGAINFNWACMMNFAYKEQPPNPHVHWHVRPRYDKVVELNGKIFDDPNFGDHYSRDRNINTFNDGDEIMCIIYSKIVSALQL